MCSGDIRLVHTDVSMYLGTKLHRTDLNYFRIYLCVTKSWVAR